MQIIPIYFKHFKKNVSSRFVVLQGSSRSGKTYSTLQWLFYLSLNKIKFDLTIVGRTIPFLRDGAVTTFKEIAPTYPIIKNPFSTTIINSNYTFRSFENEADAKGSERDFLYINECNDIEYNVVQQLIMRTRKQVIFDFNPTKKFWIDEYITDENYLKTTWHDNIYLSDAQKENFKLIKQRAENPNASAFDKYLFSVFYLGEYGDMTGNVFGRVTEIPQHEYESLTKNSIKIYGLDFGFSQDPCALVELTIVLGTIYIREILYQNSLNDFDLAKILVEECNAEYPIICDFGGGGDARMSNLHHLTGLPFVRATKGQGSIRNGVELLNTYPIYISGRNAIKEFIGYELKDGEFTDTDNHLIDASRYAIDYAMRANYFN